MTHQNLSLGMRTTLNSNRKKDTWAQLHVKLTTQVTLCSLMAFLGKPRGHRPAWFLLCTRFIIYLFLAARPKADAVLALH